MTTLVMTYRLTVFITVAQKNGRNCLLIYHIHPMRNTVKLFSCGYTTLYEALSVRLTNGPSCWSIGQSVMIKLESVKTRITAPAHLSPTGIGRVFGLVIRQF